MEARRDGSRMPRQKIKQRAREKKKGRGRRGSWIVWAAAAMLLLLTAGCGSAASGETESRESQVQDQESDLAEGQRRAQIQVVSITGNKLTYREEDQEEQTVYLPVGVIVHTPSGKETTFMILEEGDELEALFQENEDGEEVITEIWMS